ncbi:hypothetical protein FAGAP_4799 [Fusarium agapanthi]|uniref:Uncharacterized protein n=1 Tax=Fusarium agapanthi TaxID=1803897 RepID=A0A9P5BCT6_9HYPO|nr:hypothetical protein FAGAP_4799 [Fusarium agapanthi]
MFDPDSGPAFTEYVMTREALTAESNADWSRRRPYPSFKPRGTKGPRSLVDIAISVVGDNFGKIRSITHLESLPKVILWRIWGYLEARGVSLHAWRYLSKLLMDEGDEKNLGLYRFRQHICHPGNNLTRYTQPLTAPPSDFITHIVIAGGCTFNTHDILGLADMPNLGVLEIIQPTERTAFPNISDRLVRGWSEKPDPFPLLRVLRIWGDETTSKASLPWVSNFPSLALYDVISARDAWDASKVAAQEHGWEQADAPPHRLDDSLLRYLMLFAPLEETRDRNMRDLAASIDNDLVSLCSDSRCAVKFVQDRQAPLLLNYLCDTAKENAPWWDIDAASREARTCHGVAFEAWAFWLYSFLGQLCSDQDLEARGALPYKAAAGPFILPSRPIACLHLGHTSQRGGIDTRPSYISRGLYATRQFTFTRKSVIPPNGKKPGTIPKGVNLSGTLADEQTSFVLSKCSEPCSTVTKRQLWGVNEETLSEHLHHTFSLSPRAEMPDSNMTSHDGSESCFAFPDPLTALTFFNSDLTDSVLASDEGFISDDDDPDDESSVPSAYLTTFPVERLLSPLPESRSTSTLSMSPELSSSSQHDLSERDPDIDKTGTPVTPPDHDCLSSGSSSSSSESNDDSDILAPPPRRFQEGNSPNESPRASTIVSPTQELNKETSSEPDSDLPSYHVHQLDWKHPVHAGTLRARSEQHDMEIKALIWDTKHIFGPTDIPGSSRYRKELMDWRRSRREYVMNKPTTQKQAQDQRLILALSDLIEKRNRFFGKKR